MRKSYYGGSYGVSVTRYQRHGKWERGMNAYFLHRMSNGGGFLAI